MTTEPMPTVRLRNGAEEHKQLVALIGQRLQRLLNEGKAMVLYELVELCRNRDHTPFGQTGEDLQQLDLARRQTDGRWWVHESIRNIVCSAVRGEELAMTIGNPVASPKQDDIEA